MYKIKVTRKKTGNKKASTVLKKDNIGMQQMFEDLSMVLMSYDFTECKVFISTIKNNWKLKKNEPTLPFE
jgi:hypothetical protein